MIIFKLPYHEAVYTADENSDDCFVNFFSFDGREKLNFCGNIRELKPEGEDVEFPSPTFQQEIKEESRAEYLARLKKTIAFVKENQIPKLVLSRRKIIRFNHISYSETFRNLAENYPNAFVYCFSEGDSAWIGAFSELLGKYDKSTGIFSTMSLAGTLKKDGEWTSKEIDEQQTVTHFIAGILGEFSDEVSISETYDHISGNIKHLRTDLSALINSTDLEKLIEKLHPTPAVCGIPVDFCKNAIQETEKYPREFYAGYSRIDMPNVTYFFVNLRCAKFGLNHAELFVGGGITSGSDPEKEWEETELKSEAIGRNLALKL